MITCLGRQDFYVGDYDYNDGGGEGVGFLNACPVLLLSCVCGGPGNFRAYP